MAKSLGTIALENTLTPFNVVNVVLVAGLYSVYLLNDDQRLALDSVGIITVIVANTAIAIVQEWRAHRTLERAVLSVKTADVHVDDVLVIKRGDVIPADGIVVTSEECELDTSLLTGETHPLTLHIADVVHAGTFCVAGAATIRVTAVGHDTMAQRIEATAKRVDLTASPLQRTVNKIFEWSFVIALVLALIDVSVGATTILHDVDRVRRVATLLLGLIPEGLVFFSTITLTLGLIRIAQRGVVVQKLAALESFSRASVVCLDKTGTLTMNRLQVERIVPIGAVSESECRGLLGSFARSIGDEGQVIEALQRADTQSEPLDPVQRIPFSSSRKYSALRWESGPWYTLGAAERVLTIAHAEWETTDRLVKANGIDEMRTLVFARSGENGHDVVGATMEPLCLIALDDEIRPESTATLELFDEMGIRMMILTGDAPGPVRSLLRRLGREHSDIEVKARLSPEDKQEIVRTLRTTEHVVMIGDGVNDLPAIKEASVGIAMSDSAPVTKLVADVVLEHATFAEFPEMIAEGRAAIRTVLSVAKLFLAKNVILVAMNAFAAINIAPYPLTPRRGALLSIISVGIPSMFLAATARVRRTTHHFIRELFTFVAVAGCSAVVSSLLVASMFSTSVDLHDRMLFAFLGSLCWSFIVVDDLPRSTRMWAGVVGFSSLALSIALALTDVSVFPLSVIQSFYEIGGPGSMTGVGIIGCAAIGITFSIAGHGLMRWVSSRTHQHKA
ncbi:MAG: HAD-IC family P-type ATPase [Ignavibacteria bacterium]|nr:HAD-IC family P-type ATPase [Ignavibacteria bacterium]